MVRSLLAELYSRLEAKLQGMARFHESGTFRRIGVEALGEIEHRS